jgi:hypothetical protein
MVKQGYLYRQERSTIKGYYWKKYHALLKDGRLQLFKIGSGGKVKHANNVQGKAVSRGYENFSRRENTIRIEKRKGKFHVATNALMWQEYGTNAQTNINMHTHTHTHTCIYVLYNAQGNTSILHVMQRMRSLHG